MAPKDGELQVDVSAWTPRPRCGLTALRCASAELEPFDADRHVEGLFAAIGGEGNAGLWRYIPFGPLLTVGALAEAFDFFQKEMGWQTMVIREPGTQTIVGTVSYMRIREEHGSAEIGCVVFGDQLRRTPCASASVYLMAQHVFADLGYRRFEWKCNAANEASMAAAKRFGFTFEGIFRNDMVAKGANRDTAWFSMLDSEWPKIAAGFEVWLSPSNFDAEGRQKLTLAAAREQ